MLCKTLIAGFLATNLVISLIYEPKLISNYHLLLEVAEMLQYYFGFLKSTQVGTLQNFSDEASFHRNVLMLPIHWIVKHLSAVLQLSWCCSYSRRNFNRPDMSMIRNYFNELIVDYDLKHSFSGSSWTFVCTFCVLYAGLHCIGKHSYKPFEEYGPSCFLLHWCKLSGMALTTVKLLEQY